jgi:hypothetical protein
MMSGARDARPESNPSEAAPDVTVAGGQDRPGGAFLRACSRYIEQLLAAVESLGSPPGDERAEALLQQAIVLAHLVDKCPTDAKAIETLRTLAEYPDAIGVAARQVQTAMIDRHRTLKK